MSPLRDERRRATRLRQGAARPHRAASRRARRSPRPSRACAARRRPAASASSRWTSDGILHATPDSAASTAWRMRRGCRPPSSSGWSSRRTAPVSHRRTRAPAPRRSTSSIASAAPTTANCAGSRAGRDPARRGGQAARGSPASRGTSPTSRATSTTSRPQRERLRSLFERSTTASASSNSSTAPAWAVARFWPCRCSSLLRGIGRTSRTCSTETLRPCSRRAEADGMRSQPLRLCLRDPRRRSA